MRNGKGWHKHSKNYWLPLEKYGEMGWDERLAFVAAPMSMLFFETTNEVLTCQEVCSLKTWPTRDTYSLWPDFHIITCNPHLEDILLSNLTTPIKRTSSYLTWQPPSRGHPPISHLCLILISPIFAMKLLSHNWCRI